MVLRLVTSRLFRSEPESGKLIFKTCVGLCQEVLMSSSGLWGWGARSPGAKEDTPGTITQPQSMVSTI